MYTHAHLLKLPKEGWTIADETEQLRILQSVMAKQGYQTKPAINLLRQIRYWKEIGLGYYGVRYDTLSTWTDKRAYYLYPFYQKELQRRSALDFGDLLLLTLRLFREEPPVLQWYRKRFKHVLVDEFQDVSPAQYDILKMLSVGPAKTQNALPDNIRPRQVSVSSFQAPSLLLDNGNGDITYGSGQQASENGFLFSSSPYSSTTQAYSCTVPPTEVSTSQHHEEKETYEVHVFCAGDDDQSIYPWRGSQIELMRRFRFEFPDAKLFKFDVSYRMPSSLCRLTQHVIDPLPGRISKSFRSPNTAIDSDEVVYRSLERPPLEIKRMSDLTSELEWIASYIRSRSRNEGANDKLKNIAILGRFQKDLRIVSSYFAKRGVPYYENVDKLKLFTPGTAHFFRLLLEPFENFIFESALDHFVFSNTIDVDSASELVRAIRTVAKSDGLSFLEASRHRTTRESIPSSDHLQILDNFLAAYDMASGLYRQHRKDSSSLQVLINKILWIAYPSPWNPYMGRVIEELTALADENIGLEEFVSSLEGYAGIKSSSRETPLSLMTMHAAKGLEFDEVILPFWVDGNVPIEDSPSERRLAFVSLTRAKEKVIITFSQMALKVYETRRERLEDEPSMYIEELVKNREAIQSIFFEDLRQPRSKSKFAKVQMDNGAVHKAAATCFKKSKIASDFKSGSVTMMKRPNIVAEDLSSKRMQHISQPAHSRTIPTIDISYRGKEKIKQNKTIEKNEKATPVNVLDTSKGEELERVDIERLKSSKTIKKTKVKILLADEIRRRLGKQRASMPVLRKGKEISLALSKCTVEELGDFLLQMIDGKIEY